MGSESRIAICSPLRSAIWSWIELFPHEFDESIRTRVRSEGAPERVFDLLYPMTVSGIEREFWPTLVVLMCITQDRVSSDFQVSRAGPTSKAHRKVRLIFDNFHFNVLSLDLTTHLRLNLLEFQEFKFGQDIINHASQNSKLSEIALVCALDMCRAATHVRPEGEIPLRLVAYDIAHEIKVCTFFVS